MEKWEEQLVYIKLHISQISKYIEDNKNNQQTYKANNINYMNSMNNSSKNNSNTNIN